MVVQKLSLRFFLALITLLISNIPTKAVADEIFCEAYMRSVKLNDLGKPSCSLKALPSAEFIGDSPENHFMCWSMPIDFDCYDLTEAAHTNKTGALEIFTSCFYSLTGPTEAEIVITSVKSCPIFRKLSPATIAIK